MVMMFFILKHKLIVLSIVMHLTVFILGVHRKSQRLGDPEGVAGVYAYLVKRYYPSWSSPKTSESLSCQV